MHWIILPKYFRRALPILGYRQCLAYFFISVIAISRCIADCPVDLTNVAFSCFTQYTTQLQNLKSSHHKLYAGVDVEILRAFCSSYLDGMRCVNNLKHNCPEDQHDDIEVSLTNIDPVKSELDELCTADRIIETYARHQTCFMKEGSYSEYCFAVSMNSTVPLMSRIHYNDIEAKCSKMRKVVTCIKSNIQEKCGAEAASLADVLVKPMVMGSTKCTYNVITVTAEPPPTKSSTKIHTPSERQEHQIKDRRNGGQKSHSCADVLLMCLIMCTVSIWSGL